MRVDKQKMCEDCGLKTPSYGLPAERQKRWCAGCAAVEGSGAVTCIRCARAAASGTRPNLAAGQAAEAVVRWLRGGGGERGGVPGAAEDVRGLQHQGAELRAAGRAAAARRRGCGGGRCTWCSGKSSAKAVAPRGRTTGCRQSGRRGGAPAARRRRGEGRYSWRKCARAAASSGRPTGCRPIGRSGGAPAPRAVRVRP